MASWMTMVPTTPVAVDYAKGKGDKTIKSDTHVKFAAGGTVLSDKRQAGAKK